jgi:hypothetical protein
VKNYGARGGYVKKVWDERKGRRFTHKQRVDNNADPRIKLIRHPVANLFKTIGGPS